MPSHSPMLSMAFTVPATTMRRHCCRPRGCRRRRCSWHGGDVTSRCRAYDPGEASGSSTLYLGGQTLTNPRVATSTPLGWAGEPLRSRPSDLQVRSRRFADELPESSDSDSQSPLPAICRQAPGVRRLAVTKGALYRQPSLSLESEQGMMGKAMVMVLVP